MISVRVHTSGGEMLLAACDLELLGKEFREDAMRLLVSRDFYEGMEIDKEKFLEMLLTCTIANLVGEETVGAAIEGGFVDSDCIITIDGILHAQIAVYEV